ncbi:MAG: hypothetical protein L0G25_08375 [Psychrobacter sp.]|nr:hypothetical protein [Psychrobacter sp.]
MTALRIDAAVKPSSHLRLLLYVTLIGTLILLAWFAQLFLWQYLVIAIVTALVVSYLALSRPIVLHLSQPPLSQRLNQGWQLLMHTSRGDALWQAELIAVQRYQLLVHLQFKVVEPQSKLLSITIFRDQMNPTQWQALNILATVTHVQSS